MNILQRIIKNTGEYKALLECQKKNMTLKNANPILLSGLCHGAKSVLLSCLIEDIRLATGKMTLIILPEETACNELATELRQYDLNVLCYPYRDFIFHDISSSFEYEHQRLGVLDAVLYGKADAVICTPDAALQFTVPYFRLSQSGFEISASGEYDISDIAMKLEGTGYVRADMVDGCGQYSVRGGILDIFPPSEISPIRIEFFDREIEQMGYFDTVTQRKSRVTDKIFITPAREIFITKEEKEKLAKSVSERAQSCSDNYVKDLLKCEAEAILNKADISFLDKYISEIYPDSECLLDYFKTGVQIIVEDKNAIDKKLRVIEGFENQNIEEMLEMGGMPAELCRYSFDSVHLYDYLAKNRTVEIEQFFGVSMFERLSGSFDLKSRKTVSYGEDYKLLRDDVMHLAKAGYGVVMLTDNTTSARALSNMLSVEIPDGETGETEAEELPLSICDISADYTVKKKDRIICTCFPIQGFELPTEQISVLSLSVYETGRGNIKAKKRKTPKFKGNDGNRKSIMSFADIENGDYVVHANYGIGIYRGLKTLTVDGCTKDFLSIEYADKSSLYLPCNQLDMLAKYIGPDSDSGKLKLSRLGTPDWKKEKTKVKAAAKEMAKELIKLYARRVRLKGYGFTTDEQMEGDFAASFDYTETDGQLRAIAEIFDDMGKEYPMDRLLCGDVGFGKTEVALRAAFKAVCNQKQVAVLVPTTILAMQHYQTFLSRMRGFPVKVDMISRFRTPLQQRKTINAVMRGETDILIGTHRLISNDISFHDLGLVVIDEEQRFGVAQKEKLKKITDGVDVLSLSATPIPRTLSMSMSGIRDMSVLEEAPEDRLPVQTYVLEYDEAVIAEAISRELRRGGQVFYLCNSIEKMDEALARTRKLAPEDARIAFAHGKLDKDDLSDIWKSLLDGEIDILVSTTIIETGIDIPNANTLIIENSDRFGLSQLHQIRGRIGRSSRRAYAYFTYPKGKSLSEVSQKRLSAIRDYTEFGSGFKIALRDLEIRGAGNVLGAEQHGHIATVGYDMYMKLLNEAVLEERGENTEKTAECVIEINCDAYIPEKFIKSASERIDAYKKISLIRNAEDLSDVLDELCDRYGNPPLTVQNLLNISLARAFFSKKGISKISQKNGTLFFTATPASDEFVMGLLNDMRGKVAPSNSLVPGFYIKLARGENSVTTLKKFYLLLSEKQEVKKDK